MEVKGAEHRLTELMLHPVTTTGRLKKDHNFSVVAGDRPIGLTLFWIEMFL